MPDLLLELFSEEIPARMQKNAAKALATQVCDGLKSAGLTLEGAKEYWTPRRLVLDIRGLSARSADIREERKGPRTDAPQKAIEGFMRAAGLKSIDQARVINDPKKGEYYLASIEKPGRDAADIIAELLPQIITSFSWPKSMRWGEASSQSGALTWVRPLHNILCIFGSETEEPAIVDFNVGAIRSGNKTFGHRFMAPAEFSVKRFEDYRAKLKSAYVEIDASARMEIILADAKTLAFARGFELVNDNRLLEEVAGLVEWPCVLMGEFDANFLDIPPQVIQLTIRENQKCFVLNSTQSGELINHFLLVANIQATDDGLEIAKGNGKVVNARLADAKFFWDSDLAQIDSPSAFAPWIEKLDEVTFHAKLGTQGELVRRLIKLSAHLAPLVNADPAKATRAAQLCKADLNSAMVFEFPEVQGLMGHVYAKRAAEDGNVAAAIENHYKPLGPTDDVPLEPISIAVALAEKLDKLTGFWAIDEKPTGSKDPYALRRAALGIIRLLLENNVALPLADAISQAQKLLPDNVKNVEEQSQQMLGENLIAFFHDRLKVYLRDKELRHDLIDAVITPQSDDLLAISRRASALQLLVKSSEGENLLAGYKRAANILGVEEKKNTDIALKVDAKLFAVDAETTLNTMLNSVENQVEKALEQQNYSDAMNAMSALRQPIDAFFDNVMVNDDDPKIRANRLALLARIRTVIARVADFSKISG